MRNSIACWITGDKKEIVDNHSIYSRKKVNVLASLIILPTLIWGLSGFLITRVLLAESLKISTIVGLICTVIVFILDRSIILAEGGKVIYWFRIILGVTMALLCGEMLNSVIFKKDVDRYIIAKYNGLADEKVKEISSTYAPQLTGQTSRLENAKKFWQMAVEAYNEEINGTSGTGHKGVGKAATAKEAIMLTAYAEYEKQLTLLELIKQNQKEESTKAVTSQNDEKGMESIFHRIEMMHEMVFENFTKAMVYLLFFILMVSIELMVILMKVFSNKSIYEEEVTMIEQIQKSKHQMRQQQLEYLQSLDPIVRKAQQRINAPSLRAL